MNTNELFFIIEDDGDRCFLRCLFFLASKELDPKSLGTDLALSLGHLNDISFVPLGNQVPLNRGGLDVFVADISTRAKASSARVIEMDDFVSVWDSGGDWQHLSQSLATKGQSLSWERPRSKWKFF